MKRALQDTRRGIEKADLAVSEAVADTREHPAVATAGTISELADQPPLVALSLATAAAGLVARDPRLTRAGIRMLLAHALATGVKTLIKRSIDRTRPDHALQHGYRAGRGESTGHALSSFPSGHTAGAVAVSEAAARDYPGMTVPLRAASVAVAAVQIPRCKHYVSDIAVGAAIGWGAERAVSLALDAAWPRIEGTARALSDS